MKTGRTSARPGSNVCLFLKVTPPTYAGPRGCPLRGQGSVRALTTGFRAAGKSGAPSWGPVAVSMLISWVTFKLSGSGRDGDWSRETSPGLLGKHFLGRGPGLGRRAAGDGSASRGLGTWEGRVERARPGAPHSGNFQPAPGKGLVPLLPAV